MCCLKIINKNKFCIGEYCDCYCGFFYYFFYDCIEVIINDNLYCVFI